MRLRLRTALPLTLIGLFSCRAAFADALALKVMDTGYLDAPGVSIMLNAVIAITAAPSSSTRRMQPCRSTRCLPCSPAAQRIR